MLRSGPEPDGKVRTTFDMLTMSRTQESSSSAFDTRSHDRLAMAARRWRRPATVITNLDTYVGLQVARLMRRHDIPVVALADEPRAALCRTRMVDAVFDAGPQGGDTVSVLVAIAPLFPVRPVLIPCTDAAVAAVSPARDKLDYHLVLPDQAVIELLTDKSRFLDHCVRIGVPTKPYRLLHKRADAIAATAELRFPVVMKPFRTIPDWEDRLGQKAFRVSEPVRVLELWDRAAPDYPVLLQEWIEGADEDLYTYFGYHDTHGAALATFISRKVRQWPPRTGRGSFFVECRNDVLLDAALRLFSSLPYRGFAHLEMKRDAKDGIHYAVEANIGRPPGRAPIAEAGGVEMMYTAYCDALGQPLPTERVQRYGRAKWIYFAKDVASAWYYHRQGQLTLAEWLRSLAGIRGDTIFSLRDPLPFILDSWRGALRVLRRDRLSE